jgi:hypothetical protein
MTKFYVKAKVTGKYVDLVNGVYYWDATPQRTFFWSETEALKQMFPGVEFDIIPVC